METAALVSSILSIILSIIIGGFAIWLSVTFYKMSNKISEDTQEAAKGISASVSRLESLFNSLYSDTFSMMKDTVTDMRKHIWPVKEKTAQEQKHIEEKTNLKLNELSKKISEELSIMASSIHLTTSKVDDVEKNLEKFVDRAIQGTRKVESEAQEEKSMLQAVEEIYLNLRGFDERPVRNIIKAFKEKYTEDVIIDAIEFLIQNQTLVANGKTDNPDTIISWDL